MRFEVEDDPLTPDILDDKNPKFICGRPLGLAWDTTTENMIVMDTSSGIFEFNTKTGVRKLLVSHEDVIGASVRQLCLNSSSSVDEN